MVVYLLLLLRMPLWLLYFVRFVVGTLLGLYLNEMPSIITEVSNIKYRGFNYGIAFLMWPMGGVLPTLLYEAADSLATLNLSYLLFGALSLVLLQLFVPDSPRQLFITGEYEDGRRAIEHIFKIGGTNHKLTNDQQLEIIVEAQLLSKSQQDEAQQLGALFRDKYFSLTASLLGQFTIFFCLYYYISYCMPSLLNTLYAGEKSLAAWLLLMLLLVESAGYLASAFLMESPHFGRKKSLVLSYVGVCVSCIAIRFMPTGFAFWLLSVKFFVSIIITVIYPFITEMYKTSLRASMTAMCYASSQLFGSGMMALIGAMDYQPSSLFLFFGLLGAASIWFLLKLPEDRTGKPLI